MDKASTEKTKSQELTEALVRVEELEGELKAVESDAKGHCRRITPRERVQAMLTLAEDKIAKLQAQLDRATKPRSMESAPTDGTELLAVTPLRFKDGMFEERGGDRWHEDGSAQCPSLDVQFTGWLPTTTNEQVER